MVWSLGWILILYSDLKCSEIPESLLYHILYLIFDSIKAVIMNDDMPENNKVHASNEELNTDEPVTISFNNLCYYLETEVKPLSLYDKFAGLSLSGFPKGEITQKYLLTDVTGTIKPGTMTALMGPSGAGKSTLLDVLAGRKNSGFVTGELLYNGRERPADFKRIIGYVEQTDTLLPTLTPREILTYTARLKLPHTTSREFIDQRVQSVIDELGLQTCCDTIIGDANIRGISGGQAKRVNIGIELVTDPRVLFLDEPTTGLDSSTTLEVMQVIRDISRRGRSVICTIHQPSTDCFALFDKLLLLVAGESVYLGDAKDAVTYFQKFGFKFPPGSNPAEFIVAVCDPIPRQVQLVEGPKVHPRFFAEEYAKSSLARERMQSTVSAARTSRKTDSQLTKEPVLIQNNWFHNGKVLFSRYSHMRIRDKSFIFSRFGRIFFMSFIISTTFYNQGGGGNCDEQGVYNVISVLNFTAMNFAFGALAFMGLMINERKFFEREQASASYQVISYYMAIFISELPYTILQALIFSIINYWAVGLRADAGAFFTFFLICLLMGDLGIGLASFFSAIAPDFRTASSMSFPVLMVSFLFAGFYVQKPLIPDYWIWAYYISFINYGLNSLAINEFPDGDDPNGDPNCSVTDSEVLAGWGLGPKSGIDNLWLNIVVLICLWAFWRILGLFGLFHASSSAR